MSKEVYCFRKSDCDSVLNENALTTNQGIFGATWGRHNKDINLPINVTLQEKELNLFMERFHV
jgi:hypothetical protein